MIRCLLIGIFFVLLFSDAVDNRDVGAISDGAVVMDGMKRRPLCESHAVSCTPESINVPSPTEMCFSPFSLKARHARLYVNPCPNVQSDGDNETYKVS